MTLTGAGGTAIGKHWLFTQINTRGLTSDGQGGRDRPFSLSIGGDAAIPALVTETDVSDGQDGTIRSKLHVI